MVCQIKFTMIGSKVNNLNLNGFSKRCVDRSLSDKNNSSLNNLKPAEVKRKKQFLDERMDEAQTTNCTKHCDIPMPIKYVETNICWDYSTALISNKKIGENSLDCITGDNFSETDLLFIKQTTSSCLPDDSIAEHFCDLKPLPESNPFGLELLPSTTECHGTTPLMTEYKSLETNEDCKKHYLYQFTGNFSSTVKLCESYNNNYSNFPKFDRFFENRQLQYEALLSESLQTKKELNQDLEAQYLQCKHDKILNVCTECYTETHTSFPPECSKGKYCYEDYFDQYYEGQEQTNSVHLPQSQCLIASSINSTNHGLESRQEEEPVVSSINRTNRSTLITVQTSIKGNKTSSIQELEPIGKTSSQENLTTSVQETELATLTAGKTSGYRNEMTAVCDYSSLHDLTVSRDHKHFLSQENFCAFYSSRSDPPPLPVPYPLQFCPLSSRPLSRCPCDKCFSNHLTLLANFRTLNEYRAARLKSDTERRKFQNEELLKKIEASLKEGIKEELTHDFDPTLSLNQDANLPLKKRKTITQLAFTEKDVLNAKLSSYPCTPMISIAQLENKIQGDDDSMYLSLNSKSPISTDYQNENTFLTQNRNHSNFDLASIPDLPVASCGDHSFEDSGKDILLSKNSDDCHKYAKLSSALQAKESDVLSTTYLPEDTRIAVQNLIHFSCSSLKSQTTTRSGCITETSCSQSQKKKPQKPSLPRKCKRTQKTL